MSLFFEEFAVGAISISRGRTITESDIVNFAGLSGDFVEFHMNDVYAASTPFGKRIAHGALVFSISTGLMTQMNLLAETVVAYYGIDKLRFTKPVFVGDTIRLIKKVAAVEDKGPERGLVTFDSTILNQHDVAVLVYTDKLVIKKRPGTV